MVALACDGDERIRWLSHRHGRGHKTYVEKTRQPPINRYYSIPNQAPLTPFIPNTPSASKEKSIL